jgi:hypothetical protein
MQLAADGVFPVNNRRYTVLLTIAFSVRAFSPIFAEEPISFGTAVTKGEDSLDFRYCDEEVDQENFEDREKASILRADFGFIPGEVTLAAGYEMLGGSPGDGSFNTQDAARPAVDRPAFTFVRFNEDWSILRDGAPTGGSDFWDPIKYVRLGGGGDVWMSFGGHFRARWEVWRSFNFGDTPADNDEFLLYRGSLHADLHVHDWLRGFVQVNGAYSTDRGLPGGNRLLDRDPFSLEQAFVDLNTGLGDLGKGTLRVGRQQYQFGKQRLVSPLPWANTLRRWDGGTAIYRGGDWVGTGFFSYFAPTRKDEFNRSDTDRPFWGVYVSGKPGTRVQGLDFYYLGYGNRKAPTWNGTTGDETRHTLGVRVSGGAGSAWDYDVEAAYQFGEVGSGSVKAYMIGGEVGFTFKGVTWAPRVLAGIDVGSGDDEAGGDVQTFNQLYPLAHAYLGHADVVGRQNILAPSVGLSVRLRASTRLTARGFWFRRQSDQDAVYNAGGGVFRAGDRGSSSAIASEIDVWLDHRFGLHTTALVGYSHVFPGDFIRESGSAEDIDFFYVQLKYTF